jgi:hypothetical protein
MECRNPNDLELKPADVTDWRLVDFSEVPRGPWSTHGENNTFVINDRTKGKALVERLGTIAHWRLGKHGFRATAGYGFVLHKPPRISSCRTPRR